MPIPYFVYKTPLDNEPRYLGRILLKGTCDRPAVVNRMLGMGSSLTRTDINAVLELLTEAVAHLCLEGYRVDLQDLVKITPTLGGLFDRPGDTFQPGRNSVHLTAQVSKALNQRFSRKAAVTKVVANEVCPVIVQVVDSEAEPGHLELTLGHIVSVVGNRLKFDPGRSGEALRLVNARDPMDFVEVRSFHKITRLQVVFRLPEVGFTEGYLELASHLGSQTLRVGRSGPHRFSSTSFS